MRRDKRFPFVAGALAAGRHSHGALAQDIYFNLFELGAGDGWRGNIKKLKLRSRYRGRYACRGNARESAGDAGAVIAQAPLTDPPVAAVSPLWGWRILPDALTFWTDPAGADVLAFVPAGRGARQGRSLRESR